MRNDKSVFFKSIKSRLDLDLTLPKLSPSFPMFSNFIESETERIGSLIVYEKSLCSSNLFSIIGVDEAGRGPLAGPVVAAAVLFKDYELIPFVNDSKKMTHDMREFTAKIIRDNAKVGVGIVSAEEIDEINILQATFKAMHLAVQDLAFKPDLVLIDGNKLIPFLEIPQKAVIKGDMKSYSIACASIIAKTVRDSILFEYDETYPHYGFAKHKGYGTKEHIQAIREYGMLDGVHRKTFKVCL